VLLRCYGSVEQVWLTVTSKHNKELIRAAQELSNPVWNLHYFQNDVDYDEAARIDWYGTRINDLMSFLYRFVYSAHVRSGSLIPFTWKNILYHSKHLGRKARWRGFGICRVRMSLLVSLVVERSDVFYAFVAKKRNKIIVNATNVSSFNFEACFSPYLDLHEDFYCFSFSFSRFCFRLTSFLNPMLRTAFCIYGNGTGNHFFYICVQIAHQIFCVFSQRSLDLPHSNSI